jgi:hypothetical protein
LSKFWRVRDWVGLAVVAAAGGGMAAYRAVFIEPRAWGVACAAAAAPLACVPRAGLLWLQREHLFGIVALVLGVLAFLGRGPLALAVAAMVVGVAGVENYNATWGMLGAALGAWTWLGMTRSHGVAGATDT